MDRTQHVHQEELQVLVEMVVEVERQVVEDLIPMVEMALGEQGEWHL